MLNIQIQISQTNLTLFCFIFLVITVFVFKNLIDYENLKDEINLTGVNKSNE